MHPFLKWLSALLLLTLSAMAAGQQREAPEVIVVTGKLPGPPLWKVNNGDKELWIFPYLSPIPHGMIWDSARVEAVIGRSQEYLPLPDTNISVSPLTVLNPINIIRGMRLISRLTHNPDNKTLAQVLPPDLYARFATLRKQYFPRNKSIEELRPLMAGPSMTNEILEQQGLDTSRDMLKKIDRLASRNRHMKVTETVVRVKIDGGYGAISGRLETMMTNIRPEQELACFEWQLQRMESDLQGLKNRANSWARGSIDDFRGVVLAGTADDPCLQMLQTSSETATFEELTTRTRAAWLAIAEKALQTNESTFAVLNLTDLLNEDGLLAQLAAQGYTVTEPN